MTNEGENPISFIRRTVRRILITSPFLLIDALMRCYSRLLSLLDTRFEFEWVDFKSKTSRDNFREITHNGLNGSLTLKLFCPNKTTDFRARSFSTKEPETLSWLDEYTADDFILFDIGANIGLYSMYFAKAGNGKVVAFEPNILNLMPLVQNINANNLQDRIVLVPMPLTDRNTVSDFLLSDFELGSAMSAFGSDYGWDGNILNTIASYRTTGVSIDNLLQLFPDLGKPNLIKLDVDGIESLILQGGMSTLSGPSVRSILVEVNPQLDTNKILIEEILGGLGFSRRQVLQGGGNNQIWDRITRQT